jgi:hypothetical protein
VLAWVLADPGRLDFNSSKNMGRRRSKITRVIDTWEFHYLDITNTRQDVVVKVTMSRPSYFAEVDSHIDSIKFRSNFKMSNHEAQSLESTNINQLRRDVQKKIEELSVLEWQKVIIVGVAKPSNNHFNEWGMSFDYTIAERAKDNVNLFRREDGWVTRNAQNLCHRFGEEAEYKVFPYSAALETSLKNLAGRLHEFQSRLKALLQSPEAEHTILRLFQHNVVSLLPDNFDAPK